MDTVDLPVPDVVVTVHFTCTCWVQVYREMARDLEAGVEVVSVLDLHSGTARVYTDDHGPRGFKISAAGELAMRQLFEWA